MTSHDIRQAFFRFFEEKGHTIVPSAPIVVKNDPTLMFTNAGMNQFKDIFLGFKAPDASRVADTQKCLRVSGKHNDLEEVGRDTYHHTMFEMLGNWSFGDYFKDEAIAWAWELLIDRFGLDKGRLYSTFFEGDEEDGLERDEEAFTHWKRHLPEDRILPFGRKDNFWEMGDTGPCGPCSEIHIDLRSEAERKAIDGKTLVNQGHPQVVEIWNLVFIQFNRRTDGSLEALPMKHVDTGMGFERLCMAMQGKTSNYDTDIFAPYLHAISDLSRKSYGTNLETDIAFRVIADHIRAIAFTIGDGQLPSNTGAGYVIRRILRRAVRYGYSTLGIREPFLHALVPVWAREYAGIFPEVKEQSAFVARVVKEEEASFLRTLENGLKRFGEFTANLKPGAEIPGDFVFELYDTFGFPADLTRLMATEQGMTIDEAGFEQGLQVQKDRSRKATVVEAGDWMQVQSASKVEFIGYDAEEAEARVLKYRRVKRKDREQYQVVLDRTPYYAESGGQIGDTGVLQFNGTTLKVLDTKKENDLIVHFVDRLPDEVPETVTARIDSERRRHTAANHSATHLMHAALKQVLGPHVQQKGSYVGPDRLRFDFSHFEKMTDKEVADVERLVNEKIWANIPRGEERSLPIEEAMKRGATALFGEKYGDTVRVITFDPDYSMELCGGIHVEATGQIGLFKIVSEGAVAAGVRRIEAVTGEGAFNFVNEKLSELESISAIFKNAQNLPQRINQVFEFNKQLSNELESNELRLTRHILWYFGSYLESERNRLSNHEKIIQPKASTDAFLGFKPELEFINNCEFIYHKNLDLPASSEDSIKKAFRTFVTELDAKLEDSDRWISTLFTLYTLGNETKCLFAFGVSRAIVENEIFDATDMLHRFKEKLKGGARPDKFWSIGGSNNPGARNEIIEETKALILADFK